MSGKAAKVVERYREMGREAAIQLLLMPSFSREMQNLPPEIRDDVEGVVLSKLSQRKKKKYRRRESFRHQRSMQTVSLVERICAGDDVSECLYFTHSSVRNAVMEQVPEHRENLEISLDRQHRIYSLQGETPCRYCNDEFSTPHPVVESLHDAVFRFFKDAGCDAEATQFALENGAKVVRAGGDANAVFRAVWLGR